MLLLYALQHLDWLEPKVKQPASKLPQTPSFVGRVKVCDASCDRNASLQAVKNFLMESLWPHIMLKEFLPLRMIMGKSKLCDWSRFAATCIGKDAISCLRCNLPSLDYSALSTLSLSSSLVPSISRSKPDLETHTVDAIPDYTDLTDLWPDFIRIKYIH